MQGFSRARRPNRRIRELLDRGPSLGRSSAITKINPDAGHISFCRALRSGTDRGPASHRQLILDLPGS